MAQEPVQGSVQGSARASSLGSLANVFSAGTRCLFPGWSLATALPQVVGSGWKANEPSKTSR